jgi:hypothetical protein
MDELMRNLLGRNLRGFADKQGDVPSGNGEGDNPSDGTLNTDEPEGGDGGGGTAVDDKRIPYDRFKAKVEEVNRLKAKLDEIEEAEEEAKRKQLEDQNQYKELYEEALETIQTQKEDALQRTKESLLKDAGYNDGQIARLTKLVEGETEDDIKTSIDELKTDFPVAKKYADPSVGNGAGATPDKVDGEDIGRSMFEKLLASGKIKGTKK